MNFNNIPYLIEFNTAEFFLNLGRLNGDEICDTSKIKFVFSNNWQSRVFMANFNHAEASKIIEKIVSRAKKLNISLLWFINPMSRPEDLQYLLKEYGFTYQNKWVAMAIDLNTIPPTNIPKSIEIKKVTNLDELKIWTDILVKSFQFPLVSSYKKYFINIGIDNLDFHYYLGFFDGKPVSTSILFKGKETAGIFYIGTLPEVRGKGVANIMINHLLKVAKNVGYNLLVLQASNMGYPLYKKIGFKEHYITSIYRWNKSFLR